MFTSPGAAEGQGRRSPAGAPSLRALDGEYAEAEVPLLLTRAGMAEWAGDAVRILDRRLLPETVRHVLCRDVEDVARAIETMTIQGAFTLSIAAGLGLALAAQGGHRGGDAAQRIDEASRRLAATRPTGLALNRMLAECRGAATDALMRGGDVVAAIVSRVEGRASTLARQALATARHALPLLAASDALLTHCFADRALLYLLLEARRAGRTLHVYCSETRPYLQGARLTAPSVLQTGHRATVVTDGMGGFLMRQKAVGSFVTAADRVCLDGTICNKVGTYQFALAARANAVPYYVLRQSGPDLESPDETHIAIEYRDGDAVLECRGAPTTVAGVGGLYPAFDVTPPDLVTAIVTDRGVFSPASIHGYSASA